jgi:hypothetical protein
MTVGQAGLRAMQPACFFSADDVPDAIGASEVIMAYVPRLAGDLEDPVIFSMTISFAGDPALFLLAVSASPQANTQERASSCSCSFWESPGRAAHLDHTAKNHVTKG